MLRRESGGDEMGLRILIIDDDSLIREMVAASFAHAGYSVDSAADARAGIAALRTQPADLVLLDLAMPDLDGFQALASIREDAALRDTRVIMMTASRSEKDVRRARALGVAGYLAKPLASGALVERVERMLGAPWELELAKARAEKPKEDDVWEV